MVLYIGYQNNFNLLLLLNFSLYSHIKVIYIFIAVVACIICFNLILGFNSYQLVCVSLLLVLKSLLPGVISHCQEPLLVHLHTMSSLYFKNRKRNNETKDEPDTDEGRQTPELNGRNTSSTSTMDTNVSEIAIPSPERTKIIN